MMRTLLSRVAAIIAVGWAMALIGCASPDQESPADGGEEAAPENTTAGTVGDTGSQTATQPMDQEGPTGNTGSRPATSPEDAVAGTGVKLAGGDRTGAVGLAEEPAGVETVRLLLTLGLPEQEVERLRDDGFPENEVRESVQATLEADGYEPTVAEERARKIAEQAAQG